MAAFQTALDLFPQDPPPAPAKVKPPRPYHPIEDPANWKSLETRKKEENAARELSLKAAIISRSGIPADKLMVCYIE